MCDLYDAGSGGVLVEYTCPSSGLSTSGVETSDLDSYGFGSSSSNNYLSSTSDLNKLSLCFPEVDRLIFRFRYHSFYLRNDTESKPKKKEKAVKKKNLKKDKKKRKEKSGKLLDFLKKTQSKEEGFPSRNDVIGYPATDQVHFEVGSFCKSRPYECFKVVFGGGNSGGGVKEDNNNNPRHQHHKNYTHHHIPTPNFKFRFDQSEEIITNLFPEVSKNRNHYVTGNDVRENEKQEKMGQKEDTKSKGDKGDVNLHVNIVKTGNSKDGNEGKDGKDGIDDKDGKDGKESKAEVYDDVCYLYSKAENVDWSGGLQSFTGCLQHDDDEEDYYEWNGAFK